MAGVEISTGEIGALEIWIGDPCASELCRHL
jgi:hypothetical protein